MTPKEIPYSNPDKIAPAQIGDKYRLLTADECDEELRTDIQIWDHHDGEWLDSETGFYALKEQTFRTRAPLPEKYWRRFKLALDDAIWIWNGVKGSWSNGDWSGYSLDDVLSGVYGDPIEVTADAPKYKAPSSEPPYSDRDYQKSVLDAAWEGKECQLYIPSDFAWKDAEHYQLANHIKSSATPKIRIKPAEPAPVKMVPLELCDIPVPCWLSDTDSQSGGLVVAVNSDGLRYANCNNSISFKSYKKLFDCGILYSADRKTWSRCEKPAKEGV